MCSLYNWNKIRTLPPSSYQRIIILMSIGQTWQLRASNAPNLIYSSLWKSNYHKELQQKGEVPFAGIIINIRCFFFPFFYVTLTNTWNVRKTCISNLYNDIPNTFLLITWKIRKISPSSVSVITYCWYFTLRLNWLNLFYQ